MIRMMVADMLDELGYRVAGEAGDIDEAVRLVQATEFDIAILDVNVNGKVISPVAEAMTLRGLPFVFATGYGSAGLPEKFRDNPTLLTNTDRADCSDLRYWEATVTIRGQLDGKETSLDLANCAFYPDAATTDAAQRWIKLLGMNIPGPDPPF